MDRQPLMPTFLTLALYVNWFFFFLQHSLTRWIFATADQQRVSDLSECTRLERAELLSNSLSPSPFSRSLPPSDNSPPALRPLHVIPKEQKKENKKRASNWDPELRKKRTEEDWKGGKGRMDSHKTQRLRKFSSAIGSAAWILRSGVISALGVLDSTSGGLLGNPQPPQELHQPPQQQKPTKTLLCIREARSVRRTAMHRQCACTTLQTLCLFL